jgi:ABC-type phosphate transport system substrate-binding protein
MGMRALILGLVVLLAGMPGIASTSRTDDGAFKVIVHPDNPSDVVGRDFLRAAYLKKATEWHGHTIRPIDLSSKFKAREQFTQQVIRKSPTQLRTYWNQQVFSGKGVPPPEVGSTQGVVNYVLANPGAVGYLPASTDPGGAKVIRFE